MIQHLSIRPAHPRLSRLKLMVLSTAMAAFLGFAGCAKNPPPPDTSPQPLPLNSFTRLWAIETHQKYGKLNQVFMRGDYIFAYSRTGNVCMVGRNDGHLIAVSDIRHGREQLRPPVVLRDRVVYPTNSSFEMYELTGGFIGSKDVSYSVRSNAVGSGSYVYVGADFQNGGRVVKVDITRKFPDHVWELMFAGVSVSSGPALVGDALYAAGENGKVTAVDVDSREPLWSLEGGFFSSYGSIVADLVADEANLYIACEDGTLTVLNRSNGRVRWKYIAGVPLHATPAVTRDMVFQYVPGTGLVAFGKTEGAFVRTPRWVASDVSEFLAEDEKYVYGRRTDNAILAMEKTSGRAAFTSRRRDFVAFAHDTTGGMIYTVTTAGRIMAIKPVLTPGGVGEVAFAPVAREPLSSAQ